MTYPYRYFGAFRLLLALLVVFQHLAANVAPPGFAQMMHGYAMGSVAVLVFFCLSGFVIAEAADRCYRGRPGAFCANRLLRIIPHFVLATLLSIDVQWFLLSHGMLHTERSLPVPDESIFSAANIALNFISILPGMERVVPYVFIPIAWAVRVELMFYIAMAMGLYGANLLRQPLSRILTAALLLLLPCYVLSIGGKCLHVFGLAPYFSYGVALYFGLKGRRAAWWIALASIPAMVCHFFLTDYFSAAVSLRYTGVEFILFAVLVAVMTWLACQKFSGYRRADRVAGQWTYPLYLYHYVVMVMLVSLAADRYISFAWGMLASLLFAALMSRIIDPAVEHVRASLREGKTGDGFFTGRKLTR